MGSSFIRRLFYKRQLKTFGQTSENLAQGRQRFRIKGLRSILYFSLYKKPTAGNIIKTTNIGINMNPFSFGEIQELFFTLLENLTHESGRGAILIATTHADDHLKQLLEAAMRTDINNAAKEKIFNYPGPLSSFAAKIETAFMFRFINQGLYNSLHALRKIRNDAAHSEKKFKLHELKEKFNDVFNIGGGIPNMVKKTAMEILVHHKMTEIIKFIEKEDFTEEEKAKLIRDSLTDPENIKKLERQLPFWELAYGISLVCGILVYYKREVSKLTVDINTWSDLLENFRIE